MCNTIYRVKPLAQDSHEIGFILCNSICKKKKITGQTEHACKFSKKNGEASLKKIDLHRDPNFRHINFLSSCCIIRKKRIRNKIKTWRISDWIHESELCVTLEEIVFGCCWLCQCTRCCKSGHRVYSCVVHDVTLVIVSGKRIIKKAWAIKAWRRVFPFSRCLVDEPSRAEPLWPSLQMSQNSDARRIKVKIV